MNNYSEVGGKEVLAVATLPLRITTSSLRTSGRWRRIGSMKPIFIALLVSRLCLPMAGAEKKRTTVEEDGYKGQVKSVKHSRFIISEKFGKPFRERGILDHTCKYDRKGNRLERVKYNADGKPGQKLTFKYDGKGDRLEGVWLYTGWKLTQTDTFKYDEKGNKLEEVHFNVGRKLTDKTTFKYDKNGDMLEEVHYNISGNPDAKATSKYDEKENLLETVVYGANGKITIRNTYKYDEKGNVLETVEVDASGKLIDKSTSKYDEKGNKVTWTRYKPGAGLGEKRSVPALEFTWDFTYWD